jgi:NADH:ubiquinone oxidoreductase subunit E
MSDGTAGRKGTGNGEDLPAFFGTVQLPPADEVDPGIWSLIDDYLARNAGGRERLIPLLHKVQGALSYLPFSIQEYVAAKLGLSPIQVYGVVSFYHFFTTIPRGRHELKVCMGTACFVRHALRLMDTLKQTIGIDVGGVTEDRQFSLEQVRCLGACGLAPAMMHNSETLGKLTPEELRKIVWKLKTTERKREESKPPESSGE